MRPTYHKSVKTSYLKAVEPPSSMTEPICKRHRVRFLSVWIQFKTAKVEYVAILVGLVDQW